MRSYRLIEEQQAALQSMKAGKDTLLEENRLLRQTIVDLKEKHEAFKKESNRETTELLKKYSSTVVSLHQRLRKLTDKFDETEKLKKGQFRKFRKAMEEELQNIRDANEKLFMSSNEVQHKFDLQQSKLQELKQNNQQLVEARKTQMGQL